MAAVIISTPKTVAADVAARVAPHAAGVIEPCTSEWKIIAARIASMQKCDRLNTSFNGD